MGILPLQYADGDSAASLGLEGTETYEIRGLADGITPKQTAKVTATRDDGSTVEFDVTVRIDGPAEVEYYRNGGILQMVLRHMLAS
jgi:aconitate hydratase